MTTSLVRVAILLSVIFPAAASAGTIRGRVVDAETKSPLACRMYVQAADGSWRFATSADPKGTALKYSVERGPKSFEKHVTLSAHDFAVDVPPGKTTITVELGKEYQPLVKTIEVDAEPIDIELPLARWIDWGFKTYYAFLNCGFRMRPTGGTAGGVHPVPVGFGRVYVQVDGELTYEKWIEGLSAGRSFVTTGPMLQVEFNGKPAGTVFQGEDAKSARISGTADSRLPIERIEIVVNGDVVKTVQPANEKTKTAGFTSPIDETMPLTHSSWVIVRCFEKQPDGRLRFAHTAPAHFEIDGPVQPKRREVNYFIGRMEQEIARNRGVLKPEELAEYEQALKIYQALGERAKD